MREGTYYLERCKAESLGDTEGMTDEQVEELCNLLDVESEKTVIEVGREYGVELEVSMQNLWTSRTRTITYEGFDEPADDQEVREIIEHEIGKTFERVIDEWQA